LDGDPDRFRGVVSGDAVNHPATFGEGGPDVLVIDHIEKVPTGN
jgi:hypothetical protein